MLFQDSLTLDAPKRTKDGYLAVRARAARTGVYQYTGAEVDPANEHGLRDQRVVNVLRDDKTVFDTIAAHSFIGKPVTDDHPREAVTANNWRDHARGTIMGAMRDGEYLAFDILLTDAATIAKVDAGKRELSNGYGAELEFGDFRAADGTVCQARQSKITGGNHIALVRFGRAGSECAIKDGERFALCDANPAALAAFTTKEDRVKVNNLDGMSVNISDGQAVEQAITTLDNKLTKALSDAVALQAAHDKVLAAKDAEIDDLKSKVVDQATIDARADEKAEVVAKAKSIIGDALGDTKGKAPADIRRFTVAKKFGDAAVAGKSDEYVEARFDHLTADGGDATVQRMTPVIATDTASVRNLARAARYA